MCSAARSAARVLYNVLFLFLMVACVKFIRALGSDSKWLKDFHECLSGVSGHQKLIKYKTYSHPPSSKEMTRHTCIFMTPVLYQWKTLGSFENTTSQERRLKIVHICSSAQLCKPTLQFSSFYPFLTYIKLTQMRLSGQISG